MLDGLLKAPLSGSCDSFTDDGEVAVLELLQLRHGQSVAELQAALIKQLFFAYVGF